MSNKKDCMFQYAVTSTGWLREYDIKEDTGLITRKQAEELWHKYKEDFIKQLEREDTEPEMGIWIDCKDNIDYHTCIWHLDCNTKWDGRRFYNEVREYVDTEATGSDRDTNRRANHKPESELAK
jgi:hypothetical protein